MYVFPLKIVIFHSYVNIYQRVGYTKWGPQTIAKLVYNSNNYGLWYL